MRIKIHAVGRMKAGPERELAQRYFDRFSKSGPAVGLEWGGITETPESRAQGVAERKRDEARRVEALLEGGALLVLLDERGRNIGSDAFARHLATHRDQGQRQFLFAIGGPDGHDPALRDAAALVLSFGALTFPHQLVRIMLAEQLYRASTILAGYPYHRP